MLKPRFEWDCSEPGCCVFCGGTDRFDIYMSRCNESPWNPGVVLVEEDSICREFESQEAFAHALEGINDWSATDRADLKAALTFVQCFFPTPERWALNEIRKEEG